LSGDRPRKDWPQKFFHIYGIDQLVNVTCIRSGRLPCLQFRRSLLFLYGSLVCPFIDWLGKYSLFSNIESHLFKQVQAYDCTNSYANVHSYIVPIIVFFIIFPLLTLPPPTCLNTIHLLSYSVYIHNSPGERGKNLSTMPDHIYYSVPHVFLLLATVSKLQKPIDSTLLD